MNPEFNEKLPQDNSAVASEKKPKVSIEEWKAYLAAKKHAIRYRKKEQPIHPGSPEDIENKRKIKEEQEQKEQEEHEQKQKEEFAKQQEEERVRLEKLQKEPQRQKFHVIGKIDVVENKKPHFNRKESIFNDAEAVTQLKEKLKDVYLHRPDPRSFVGAMKGTRFSKEYTKEKIDEDIKYTETITARYQEDNARYGEKISEKIESNIIEGEMLQALITDLFNKGWIPEIKAIMTSITDDLRVGMDLAMRYKKDEYFGASFDMTVSEEDVVIQNKLKKHWKHYIQKGRMPKLKYFEDPENPKIKGNRMMPKFIIGGSHQDLEILARAYLQDDMESIQEYPLKYAIVAQIEEQLTKIIAFYEARADVAEFKLAYEQYVNFKETFQQIKESINYEEKIADPTIAGYISENKILNMSKKFDGEAVEQKIAA